MVEKSELEVPHRLSGEVLVDVGERGVLDGLDIAVQQVAVHQKETILYLTEGTSQWFLTFAFRVGVMT